MLVILFSIVTIVTLANNVVTTADKIDICHQDPITQGNMNTCKGFFQKYTFNATVGKCQIYIYGGCDGSKNLFDSLLECERICGSKQVGDNDTINNAEEKVENNSKNRRCLQRRMRGFCRAYIPSYYYNAKKGKCRFFGYGGCGGNDNRFESLQECQAVCKV